MQTATLVHIALKTAESKGAFRQSLIVAIIKRLHRKNINASDVIEIMRFGQKQGYIPSFEDHGVHFNYDLGSLEEMKLIRVVNSSYYGRTLRLTANNGYPTGIFEDFFYSWLYDQDIKRMMGSYSAGHIQQCKVCGTLFAKFGPDSTGQRPCHCGKMRRK